MFACVQMGLVESTHGTGGAQVPEIDVIILGGGEEAVIRIGRQRGVH